MTLNTFFKTWKWPNRQEDTATSNFDIPAGVTNIDVPSALLNNFRNFSFEFIFSSVSASDNNLTANFVRANDTAAYALSNVETISGAQVTLDAAVTSNANLVFVRDLKNLDNNFLRIIINAPSGVTANMRINVRAGGNAQ